MPKKLPLFNYESLVHAIAAVTGSTVAVTSFYPLEAIKFRTQLDDSEVADKSVYDAIIYIIKNEGLSALYRGLKPNVTAMGVSNFVYFYIVSGLRNLVPDGFESTKTDLIINALGGIANVLITNPVWVVTNRLKSKQQTPFKGIFEGLLHISNNEGWRALWYGVVPSLILVSNPVIHFTIYQGLKRKINVKSATGFFLMGAFSKAIATILTYPVQLAQTRQRSIQEGKLSTGAILLKQLKKNGLPSLYQGLETKMLQTVLATALMFMCYEKIAQFVFFLLLSSRRTRGKK